MRRILFLFFWGVVGVIFFNTAGANDFHNPDNGEWVYLSSECRFPGPPTEPDGLTRIVGDFKQSQWNALTLGNMGTGVQGTISDTPSYSYHDYPYSYISCETAHLERKCIDIICGNSPWLFVDASQQPATQYFNDDCGCNTYPYYTSNQSFWWIGTRQKIYSQVYLYKWKSNCNAEYNAFVEQCGNGNIIEWSNTTCSGLCEQDKSYNFSKPSSIGSPSCN